MELKKWKDYFSCNCPQETENCPLIEIRAEAIKRIKALQKVFFCPKCHEKDSFPLEDKFYCESCDVCWKYNEEYGKISELMYFFNISEDDLR